MRTLSVVVLLVLGLVAPARALAQSPATAPTAPQSVALSTAQSGGSSSGALARGLQIRAFGVVGMNFFAASSTFNAVLGSNIGPDYGGGLNLARGPLYLEAGARRFAKDGERVFVAANQQVFPLGIATTVTMTPFDLTAGWRFGQHFGRVIPHVGVGYTRMKYEETSDFADADENVTGTFNGFHLVGGAEVRITRWIGVTGEAMWTSIADALGEGGAAKAFDETNLGGTSLRLKLVIGR